MYLNLVKSVQPEAPASVHMSDWPDFSADRINQKLINDMDLVMRLVSLGHAARNQSGIKVRQPLQEVAFMISNKNEEDVIEEYADLFGDELNVKKIRSLSAASEAAAYELVPLPRQLGQKYKSDFPKIQSAILTLDAEKYAKELLDGRSITVMLGTEEIEIYPDEVEVRLQAKEGFVVASEGAYLAALVTDITPSLRNEGLAREFVRRVQETRKQAGFEISDRIKLFFTASDTLLAAVHTFEEYIMAETLTIEIVTETNPNTLPNASDEFDGETLAIWLEKA